MRKRLEERIGRKVMAYEAISDFATGEHIATRGRSLGIIHKVSEGGVTMYYSKNPEGYKYFTIPRTDFENWVKQGLYKIV